jgi:hypothetical protein
LDKHVAERSEPREIGGLMRVELLDYVLPPEQIAQHPAEDREQARLLVLGPGDAVSHRRISELADILPERALLVLNDTRVVPARLIARKDTGGKVEVFLVRPARTLQEDGRDVEVWRALGRASKSLKMGIALQVVDADGTATSLSVRILGRGDDGLLEVALWTAGSLSVADAIERWGRMPLPPYIKRDAELGDVERYQTVYARVPGCTCHARCSVASRCAATRSRRSRCTWGSGRSSPSRPKTSTITRCTRSGTRSPSPLRAQSTTRAPRAGPSSPSAPRSCARSRAPRPARARSRPPPARRRC